MKQKKTIGLYTRYDANSGLFAFALTAILFLLTQCKKEITPESENGEVPAGATKKPSAPVIVVNAGASIKAAVDAAAPGSTIKIKTGVYKESIEVNKPGITIEGEGNVVIENPGGKENGILVTDAGDGFTLKNVTVRNFEEIGVGVKHVDNFLLSHITITDTRGITTRCEFGLFTEFSSNGVIEHCNTSGQRETGIFIGQSSNVTVAHNQSHDNVIGLETENSSFVTMENNHAYNNSVGIALLLVPGRTVKQSSNIILTKNQVRENNLANFAPRDESEFFLPSGVGILNLGADQTVVQDNHVTGNNFTGIAVVSSLVYAVLAGLPVEAFADIEPNPDGVKVISNQVTENGAGPDFGPFPSVDLLWDGSGSDNCWSKNLYGTSAPQELPSCP